MTQNAHDLLKSAMIKEARSCCTAQAWEQFVEKYGDQLKSISDAKVVEEIFNIVSKDELNVYYSESLWVALLRACLTSWNQELGIRIADIAKSIPSVNIGIQSAEVYLQSGSPQKARTIAQRFLRHSSVEPWQRLQLRMLICNSYVEEGKNQWAVRHLDKMAVEFSSESLSDNIAADLLNGMGRALFFLGKYLQAAENFTKAFNLYSSLGNWENATKAIFNAAAGYHNIGPSERLRAFNLIKECKKIAKLHQLEGALSHCYAFFGIDNYQHGSFVYASKNFQKALDLCPAHEKSFRRIHITSMLALSYLKTNRIESARKYGKITRDLATHDQSERFRSRYNALEGEIKWYEGDLNESQKFLVKATNHLKLNGINTLEELSAFSRLHLQYALLNASVEIPATIEIADSLKKTSVVWLEMLHAEAEAKLTRRDYSSSLKSATECYDMAKDYQAPYFQAQAVITIIYNKLAQSLLDSELMKLVEELGAISNDFAETNIPFDCLLIKSAICYQSGDYKGAIEKLNLARKLPRIPSLARKTINCWNSCIHGQSPKVTEPLLQSAIARTTRVLFAPTLEFASESVIKISHHYEVPLERHQLIAKLIKYLIDKPGNVASNQELRENVWGDGSRTQGWEQKIRNTLMRVRHAFPYSIAPLVIHTNHEIRLNIEAIKIVPTDRLKLSLEQEILSSLESGEYSTAQLSKLVGKSDATIKRSLARLSQSKKVLAIRMGKQIVYKSNHSH